MQSGSIDGSQRTVVRAVREEDVSQLADVLAGAFYDDPAGKWMVPDERTRLRRLRILFESQLRLVVLPHGECVTTPDLAGVALWKPPGHWKIPARVVARFVPDGIRATGRRLPLVLRGLATVEKHHPKAPHYYLPFVGVAPDQQNRGIGSALLVAVLEKCDRERVGAYLEASAEANRRLYLRHGFEVAREITLPKGPPVWAMWRNPR